MDPVTLITSVIAIAGAIYKSYDELSKLVVLVQNAPKELEAMYSRAGSINSLVTNLQQALGECAIRKAIEKDKLALNHARALDEPLSAVRRTLEEVVAKVNKSYRLTADGKHFKIRWRYYLGTNEWEELQKRLNFHIQVLSASMQGLNTLNVLRVLGGSSNDPARTLRTYANSILEIEEGQESTLVDQSKTLRRSSSIEDPPAILTLDERRLLARKKVQMQRDLLQAARGGDYLDVSLLLGGGAETEWTEENEGMTALHFAAKYGHIRVAKLLLEAGADIEAESDAFGDEWVVRTEKSRTPLIWAAAGRDCPLLQERMCKFLLDMGADVNARNVSARTALQEAAMSQRYGNIDPTATIELLLNHGANVNAYDKNGWTALTECAAYGNLELVRMLLANGAHIDGNHGQDILAIDGNPNLNGPPFETPLFACCEWSWDEDLIVLLLDQGANTKIKDVDGKTLAEMASEKESSTVLIKLEMVEKLRQTQH